MIRLNSTPIPASLLLLAVLSTTPSQAAPTQAAPAQAAVQGYVIQPRSKPDTQLPVIIYNRGGNPWFATLKFDDLYKNLFPLADEGFIIIASQYRGAHHCGARRGQRL